MAKTKDKFEMWLESDKWPEYRDFLKEATKYDMTQKEICRRLHITEATFIKLKKKHKEIQDAMDEGLADLKDILLKNIFVLACGYDEVTEQKVITDKGNGVTQEKKIYRTVRKVGPDMKANLYLLSKKFGIEYDPNYEQLKLAKEKAESNKEEWPNGKTIGKDSE